MQEGSVPPGLNELGFEPIGTRTKDETNTSDVPEIKSGDSNTNQIEFKPQINNNEEVPGDENREYLTPAEVEKLKNDLEIALKNAERAVQMSTKLSKIMEQMITQFAKSGVPIDSGFMNYITTKLQQIK